MGMPQDEQLLVVSYTASEDDDNRIFVRIISARPATRRERRQFRTSE